MDRATAARNRRLRQAIAIAIGAAWEADALTDDWAGSLYAALSEPPAEDDAAWVALDSERASFAA